MSTSQSTTLSSQSTISLGQLGERFAASYLEQCGYQLVAANFVIPVGRNIRGVSINAEIDLIAYEETTLCFIEVKTRASHWFAPPQVNVDKRKRRQISRAAHAYRQMFDLIDQSYRYDVVTIVLADGVVEEIELLKHFWNDSEFARARKRTRYYD